MKINNDFETIINHAHFWNWAPDWTLMQEIYIAFPNSYSILIPFAYSYLEELIRSTTTEYGKELISEDGTPKIYRKVGTKLIDLAINENQDKLAYIKLLDKAKAFFKQSSPVDRGENRNSVNHGYMHPRFWDKESFENLIRFIARISKYSGF